MVTTNKGYTTAYMHSHTYNHCFTCARKSMFKNFTKLFNLILCTLLIFSNIKYTLTCLHACLFYPFMMGNYGHYEEIFRTLFKHSKQFKDGLVSKKSSSKFGAYLPSKRMSWIINFRAICRDCVKEIKFSNVFTPSDSLNSIPLATLSVERNTVMQTSCTGYI